MAVNHKFYCSPMMLYAPRFGLPGHIMAAGGAMGKIVRLNTTRFYTEIGAGEVFRQAGRYSGIYKLRRCKFANNSLAKPCL